MTRPMVLAPSAKAAQWTGRVLSAIVVLFMLGVSAAPKVFLPEVSAAAMARIGWPGQYTLLIAAIEVTGAVLYAVPRTAVAGAVVLTGLFGGAVATHLRVGDPLHTHVLFPVYLGALMWAGLWLRTSLLRDLVCGNLRGGQRTSTA